MKTIQIIFFAASLLSSCRGGNLEENVIKPMPFPKGEIPEISGKIIGGEMALRGEYPYIVAVYVTTPTIGLFCAGTIISPLWILSAAHCVQNAVSTIIQFGTTSLNSTSSIKVPAVYNVIHPQYNAATLAHDIALSRLRIPVGYSEFIKPVTLPQSDVEPNAILRTAGWGQVDETPGLVNDLHVVLVMMLDDVDCKSAFGDSIVAHMVCVNGVYNAGTCRGDSGSPLVHVNTEIYPPRHTMIGISCFISRNGCMSTDPSGFTKVYPYMEWIKNVTLLPITDLIKY